MPRLLLLATVALLLSATPQAAPATQQPPPDLEAAAPELSPREIQRLFDAYAVVQAQEVLKLTDAQYPQFVLKLRALQETRRHNQQARNQLLQDLGRLARPEPPAEESAIRDRLRALQEHDARSAAELRKAYDALDEVLDVRQQARFRLFEEQMERRKFELLMRARQNQRLPPPRRRPMN